MNSVLNRDSKINQINDQDQCLLALGNLTKVVTELFDHDVSVNCYSSSGVIPDIWVNNDGFLRCFLVGFNVHKTLYESNKTHSIFENRIELGGVNIKFMSFEIHPKASKIKSIS